jgi:hypothetical protein
MGVQAFERTVSTGRIIAPQADEQRYRQGVGTAVDGER